MRRNLIAATILLLFLGTTAHAQDANQSSDGFRYVAIGAGVITGAWVVNLLTAGAPAAVVAMNGVLAGGTPGAGAAVGAGAAPGAGAALGAGAPAVVGGEGASLFLATRGLLMIIGAGAGGYIGAWLYDG